MGSRVGDCSCCFLFCCCWRPGYPELIMQPRMTFELWSSCLCLLSTGITNIHHIPDFCATGRGTPGSHEYAAGTLQIELHPLLWILEFWKYLFPYTVKFCHVGLFWTFLFHKAYHLLTTKWWCLKLCQRSCCFLLTSLSPSSLLNCARHCRSWKSKNLTQVGRSFIPLPG